MNMENNVSELLNTEFIKKQESICIFKNENIFSKDYIPSSIIFRESQFKQLIQNFKGLYLINESNISYFQTATLIGPVGCGKSNLTNIFCREFIKTLHTKFSSINFLYRHINCRRNRSIFLILFDLLRSLIPNFPSRGFSSSELLNMLQIMLHNSNSYLILALDEIDFLFQDKEIKIFFDNLTYNNNLSSEKETKRISLIFITRNRDFLLLLDPENKFGILTNIIKFENYKKHEIKEILLNRSKLGLNEGTLPLIVLDYISEHTLKLNDIRYSIELLWRTVKISELSKSNYVKLEHLKKAIELTNNSK